MSGFYFTTIKRYGLNLMDSVWLPIVPEYSYSLYINIVFTDIT